MSRVPMLYQGGLYDDAYALSAGVAVSVFFTWCWSRPVFWANCSNICVVICSVGIDNASPLLRAFPFPDFTVDTYATVCVSRLSPLHHIAHTFISCCTPRRMVP